METGVSPTVQCNAPVYGDVQPHPWAGLGRVRWTEVETTEVGLGLDGES